MKRFEIPIPEEAAAQGTPYRPAAGLARRWCTCRSGGADWAGICRTRTVPKPEFKAPALDFFKEWTGRLERARGVDDDGLRVDPARVC